MSEARIWFEFARTDLRMAELAQAEGLYAQACFHAHQAVEKMLKGFLLARGRRVPRTHSLLELARLAREHGFPLELSQKIRVLDSYYLPTRYPDAPPRLSDLPGAGEAAEALEAARSVWEWLKNFAPLPDSGAGKRV